MLCVVEKIEGQWAVIEWGKESFRIPKCLLPGNVRSGDRVTIEVRVQGGVERLRRTRDCAVNLIDE